MIDLTGKNILITGASSGIGRETAILAGNLGAVVTVTGRNKNRLDETFQRLKGKNNLQFVADLSEEKNIVELTGHLPEFDGIVHCAGITSPMPVKFIREKHLQEVFKINYFASVLLTGSLLSKGKIKNASSIIFVSSVSTQLPYFGGTAYIASKAATESYCKTLAFELAPQKIRVNCISPGLVRTAVYEEMRTGYGDEKMEEYEKKYPLGFGKPADVANAVVFLLSDASGWITGTIINLDGGLLLGR